MGSGPTISSTATVAADLAICRLSERDARSEPYASIAVHSEIAPAEAAWRELERSAPISGYQTLRWMKPWIETIARANSVEPMIVVANDRDGMPVAILPLGIVRAGPLRKAAFLGGRDANLNMGLFRPGTRWTRSAVRTLLERAVQTSRARVDLFHLRHQPLTWRGHANPLACLTRFPSPSFSAFGRLETDAEAFFAARTRVETRKTLRKKARRLVKHFGELEHVVAGNAVEAQLILEAFQGQKAARLRSLGLPDLFADRSLMAFLLRGATDELPSPAIELHALYAGERIVATFGGTAHASRFSGMFISFDDDIEVARSSPGDQLLRCVVKEKCAQGFELFDLGIGEALYKTNYCDEVEPLFDALFPVTALGRGIGKTLEYRIRFKRFLKQTPWAWAAIQSYRRLRSGR